MVFRTNSHTRSMKDFVDSSLPNSLQLQNSSYFMVDSDTSIIEDMNIFRDRYYNQLMSYAIPMVFSDDEYNMYKYRPKKLSAELYDTIDYWYILLIINKMSTMLQFKKKVVKVLSSDGVRFIKTILQKEEKEISENKLVVNKDLKNMQ